MPDIAVSSCHVVYGASDILSGSKGQLSQLAVNVSFDLFLYLSLDLLSASADDLDPIVVLWIVAGRDHDTAVKILCPYHKRHTWRGGDMEQECVSP